MRLIDADKLYPDCMTKKGTLAISQNQIANAPTVEKPIKGIAKVGKNGNIEIELLNPSNENFGKWIFHKDFNDSIKYGCNQCGNLTNIPSNFCPNCGKRMLKGAEK